MQILLSNDDGIGAPGLRVLAEHLRELGDVTVVAPDRNRSGASNSLTLSRPLRVTEHGPGMYAVDGTPTDCVHLAMTGLLDTKPDIVISGINAGANLGDDVLYSGTVAAAMEGRSLGLPAIAVSCVDFNAQHYETAARATLKVLAEIDNHPLPAQSILSLNVPDCPYDELAGFEVTRLGNRHVAEGMVRSHDPRGRIVYWIGPAGSEQDAGPGTDFHAVKNNFVSVTPLHADLTHHDQLAGVQRWFEGLKGL